VVITTAYSKQLKTQSLIDLSTIVASDILDAIGVAADVAILSGTGTTQPTGILNYSTTPTSGYNWVNLVSGFSSGTPTLTSIVSFEELTDAANSIPDGTGAYIISPSDKKVWKTTPKSSGNSNFIWESSNELTDAHGSGIVNGYKAFATNNMTSGQVVFSNRWSSAMLLMWSGVDICTDFYTMSQNNQVIVTTTVLLDVVLRHGPSFAIAN
jgi:HK97 family phage major capsid protein